MGWCVLALMSACSDGSTIHGKLFTTREGVAAALAERDIFLVPATDTLLSAMGTGCAHVMTASTHADSVSQWLRHLALVYEDSAGQLAQRGVLGARWDAYMRRAAAYNDSATVALTAPAPESAPFAAQPIQETRSGTDGSYAFAEVRPGDYYIAAATPGALKWYSIKVPRSGSFDLGDRDAETFCGGVTIAASR